MNRADTAELLGMCAAFDARTVGDADVLAWHAVLGDMDFEDAKTAVANHYRDSRERVMPADVRAGVKRIRAARLVHPDAIPDADPDDVPSWMLALRQGRVVVASGGTRSMPPVGHLTRRVNEW